MLYHFTFIIYSILAFPIGFLVKKNYAIVYNAPFGQFILLVVFVNLDFSAEKLLVWFSYKEGCSKNVGEIETRGQFHQSSGAKHKCNGSHSSALICFTNKNPPNFTSVYN